MSESTLKNIWSKAEKLVVQEHLMKVPWSNDDKDRLVKSLSSAQPHLVTRDPKNISVTKTVRCLKGSLSAHMSLQRLM